ncbi:MAG: sugar phosphate isomerase/epimerase family protein [Verrucomicrobiia bacterium]
MRLGIGSYAFAWNIGVPGHPPPKPWTAFDLLVEAERLGVRLVQFCDNLPLAGLSEPDLAEFERRARSASIQIELGTRGLAPEHLRAHLRLCERLGSPILRLVIDSPGDEPSAKEAVARLNPLLSDFASSGVLLAIENHDRFSSATLAWMIRQLGVERAGICLDTVNSFGALEGPEAVVKNLGQFTACLHVKDFTIRRVPSNMGFTIEGCAAGQGRLDVPWLLRELKASPHPFNAILETWVTPGNPWIETLARERAWGEQGVRYLRTLLPD